MDIPLLAGKKNAQDEEAQDQQDVQDQKDAQDQHDAHAQHDDHDRHDDEKRKRYRKVIICFKLFANILFLFAWSFVTLNSKTYKWITLL
ncbi:hypothetical protein FRC00_007309, partial [Tulasnella sp. 408]